MPTKTKTPKMLRKNFDKWLAKQGPDRKFHYLDHDHCLFASFLNETLRQGRYSCGTTWATGPCPGQKIIFPSWARRVNAIIIALPCVFTVAELRAEL